MTLPPPPIGSDLRSRIRQAIPDLLEWGAELFARTNQLFRWSWRPQPTEIVAVLFGNRACNCLRAIDALQLEQSVDDQIAILTRALVEMALDGAYIHQDTIRVIKKKTYHLSCDDKVRLFRDFKTIMRNKIGVSFPLSDRSTLFAGTAFRKAKGIDGT